MKTGKLKHIYKFKIADIIVHISSYIKLRDNSFTLHKQRFSRFMYSGKKLPSITIDVKVVDSFPEITLKPIFVVYDLDLDSANWKLYKKNNEYIYAIKCIGTDMVAFINRKFDKARVFISKKEECNYRGEFIRFDFSWEIYDVVTYLLQFLMTHYLIENKLGVIIHCCGIKNRFNKGFIFAGSSGCGKTTIARIMEKSKENEVLNDDRIIVRKSKDKFKMYASPWRGEFENFVNSNTNGIDLNKIYFIYPHQENVLGLIEPKKAFYKISTLILASFWNKEYIKRAFDFCKYLVKDISCYDLGFKNNKSITKYLFSKKK
ncbi:MAG: hypothetical protein P9L96_03180 [Candidatus Gygaella obscura]|nr:hypothetical protein [Candidatus Gygaella obscura]